MLKNLSTNMKILEEKTVFGEKLLTLCFLRKVDINTFNYKLIKFNYLNKMSAIM